MNKKDVIVVLITAHRKREPGKHSPDGELYEYAYSRELCQELKPKLESYGILTEIDILADDLDKTMQTPSHDLELQRELAMRVNIIRHICNDNPDKLVLCVSPHLDASPPVDNQWHQANGWSVRVSPKASAESRLLADCLYDAAVANGLRTRKPTDSQKYWKQSLYVLNRTPCPAVLTENLFQDNRADKDFLMSDEGRHVIERIHVEGILKAIEII